MGWIVAVFFFLLSVGPCAYTLVKQYCRREKEHRAQLAEFEKKYGTKESDT